MELEIKNQSDQITHLALRGRIDTAGVGQVELKFTSHTVPRAKPLLLDMSEVTFLSSLGLADALDRCQGVGSPWGQNGPPESAAGCAGGPQNFRIRSADARPQ